MLYSISSKVFKFLFSCLQLILLAMKASLYRNEVLIQDRSAHATLEQSFKLSVGSIDRHTFLVRRVWSSERCTLITSYTFKQRTNVYSHIYQATRTLLRLKSSSNVFCYDLLFLLGTTSLKSRVQIFSWYI